MIERWKAAGQPLDLEVRHRFSVWASIVGGILGVNGFPGENESERGATKVPS